MAKQSLNVEHLTEVAQSYADIMARIKALELDAKPLAEEIKEAYKKAGLKDTLDLGPLRVVPRDRKTQHIDMSEFTPDWLFRYTQRGGTLKVNLTGLDDEDRIRPLAELLNEIKYEEECKTSLALIFNALSN